MENVTPLPVRAYQGGKISEPGIYSGVPIESYHADICVGPSISSGGLRAFEAEDSSPAHFYLHSYLNPDHVPEPPKAAWIIGRAAHTLLLGEAGFNEEYVIRPDAIGDQKWNANANVCKAWLAEQAQAGRTVLKGEDITNIKGMARSLAAHPIVQQGILNGLPEHSIFWRDEETGVWLKSRMDNIPTDGNMIVDLKTCDSASPIACRRSITNYGYHQQGALGVEGMKVVAGRDIADVAFVFIEKTAPWAINIKPLDAEALEWGRLQNRRAVRAFAKCFEEGRWPSFEGDDLVAANLLDFKRKSLEYERDQGLFGDA